MDLAKCCKYRSKNLQKVVKRGWLYLQKVVYLHFFVLANNGKIDIVEVMSGKIAAGPPKAQKR